MRRMIYRRAPQRSPTVCLRPSRRRTHESNAHRHHRVGRRRFDAGIGTKQSPSVLCSIEDYYRVKTVGGLRLSDDGRTVTFTVSTRVEENNQTRTETFTAPTDGSAAPTKIETRRASGRRQLRARDGDLARRQMDRDPQGRGASRLRHRANLTDFEKRHLDRFKGVTFDWKDFQRDGQPFPAPNLRARPRQQIVLTAAGRRRSEGAARSGSASDQSRLASERKPAGVRRRSRLAERAQVREPRSLQRDDRWSGDATHQRRLRLQRSRVLTGRSVPGLRAHLRDRHGDRAEAEPRRASRSLRSSDRGRRADQPHGELGSRAGRCALLAGWKVHLLPGRHRRRRAPLPRLGARRPGDAGHARRAPAWQSHLRQGDDQDRLHRDDARSRRRRSTSPTSTGPASGESPTSTARCSTRSRSARPIGSSGRARTAPRSKAGSRIPRRRRCRPRARARR